MPPICSWVLGDPLGHVELSSGHISQSKWLPPTPSSHQLVVAVLLLECALKSTISVLWALDSPEYIAHLFPYLLIPLFTIQSPKALAAGAVEVNPLLFKFLHRHVSPSLGQLPHFLFGWGIHQRQRLYRPLYSGNWRKVRNIWNHLIDFSSTVRIYIIQLFQMLRFFI